MTRAPAVIGPVSGERLVESLMAAGLSGAVLVVADAAATGRLGPLWAREFAAAGRVHRVRQGGDVAALVTEARGLGAAAVAGVGDGHLLATAAAAAAAAGLPFIRCPAVAVR